MMRTERSQRGATLIVSLLMLTTLTLMAVAAIGSSNVNLRIVNNVQSQNAAEAIGQEAVEDVLSDIDNFKTPTANTGFTPESGANGYEINIAAATCLRAVPATGYSAKWALTPEDTTWEVVSTTNDTVTDAQAVVHQGVRIRKPTGYCP